MKKLILLIFLISQFSTSVFAGEPISEVQAKTIAENFVEIEKQNFPSWNEVSIKNSHAIYSSNGVVVGYEISFHDKKGNDRGYLIVGSDKNETIIPSFSENGSSIYDALVQYYESNLKQRFESLGLIPKETIFLGRIPFHFAVGVKFQEGDHIENNDFISQDGWFIFSPNPDSQKKVYKKSESTRRSSRKSNEENEEFYDALINGDKNSKFFKKKSSGRIGNVRRTREAVSSSIGNGTPVEGSKLFSNFTQKMDPNKPWTKGGLINGKCAAGCGPVGWAILLEYWDRNGYPNLVSSITDNANRTTTDPDVRWTINELRGYLETTCKDGQGETMPWNIDQGEDYIKSRGYESNISTNMDFEPGFWDVIRDINANRPPLILFDSSKDFTITGNIFGIPNHYVVAYAYDDYFGKFNDRFKVKTGWNYLPDYPTDKWFNRDTISKWGAGVTSVEITSPATSSNYSSVFQGAGSLIEPSTACWGCDKDQANMHKESVSSTVVFQWKNASGGCPYLKIDKPSGLNQALISTKSWSATSIEKTFLTFLPVTIPNSGLWTTTAVTSLAPLTSQQVEVIARCSSSDTHSSNRKSASSVDVKFSNGYTWAGNGSIISDDSTCSSFGCEIDHAAAHRTKKSLTAFQWQVSSGCKNLRIQVNGGGSFSGRLKYKGWSSPSWDYNSSVSFPKTVSKSTAGLYYVFAIETSAGAIPSGKYIEAICQ